jgi:hypothetical protein
VIDINGFLTGWIYLYVILQIPLCRQYCPLLAGISEHIDRVETVVISAGVIFEEEIIL